jgi:hypothetical protein
MVKGGDKRHTYKISVGEVLYPPLEDEKGGDSKSPPLGIRD